ncbi:MAG TPA: thiamine-phosphate kinase [Gemmatimonadetes bacterium]|nr:thiamine-phosphate kinase [Gemmatimonadota bacterium]HAT18190.1 thiamine-phosphate kinase [Gemmatimonadota bacterium]
MTVVGEFDLIRDLLAKVNQPDGTGNDGQEGVWLGAGDDAAVLDTGRLVMSTDLTVEDVHFRRSWVTFAETGARAVTAAASDLAAMAATPVAVLISVAIAPLEARAVLSELGDGIKAALRELGAPLVGGDLSASPGPVFIDVTVVGAAEEPVTRSGAHPGDELWVTGVLGGSAGAVRAWWEGAEPSPDLRASFVQPKARIEEARWLADQVDVSAMIDLSDGLAGDARDLAAASGVRIVLDPRLVPVHPDLDGEDAWSLAMSGGEDYELCFVSPPDVTGRRSVEFQERFGIELTRVGHVEDGTGVEVLGEGDGLDGVSGGFDHFSSDRSC